MADSSEDQTDLEMMLDPTCWPNQTTTGEGKRAGLLALKRYPTEPGFSTLDKMRFGALLARELDDKSWYYVFTPGKSIWDMPTADEAMNSVTGLQGVVALLIDAGWVVD